METIIKTPRAPLFRDPERDGPADPMVIWNREERSWWMLYTARRANKEGDNYAWCFGTGIGVASSTDGGRSFVYRGELPLHIEPGFNTYWAPEVIWQGGVYHMYVTYSRGCPDRWHRNYYMAHLTATNMWEWHFEGFIELDSKPTFDATCQRMPDGKWRMWYRGRGETVCVESADLHHWTRIECEGVTEQQEGPNVFFWKDWYWMIADTWRGQAVYRSKDAISWEYRSLILDKPGSRPYDQGYGQHASVLINDDRAFIFYFTNPKDNRDENRHILENLDYDSRRSLVQVAELEFDGDTLVCDRDKEFHMDLQPEDPVETYDDIL